MQPLLLLHGALGAASAMLPLSKALDGKADVHMLDFSGHGESPWPDEGFTIATFERDVLKYMDARGIDAAHIFGYSMGGFIGLRLAAQHPSRIQSLTTLAMKLDWDEDTCVKEAASLNADTLQAKVPRFVEALAAAHPCAGWRKIVNATSELLSGMHHYRLSDDMLAQIDIPVKLMVGNRDKMVGIEETQAAFRALPNGEFVVLANTPHPLEAADTHVLATLILKMLQEYAPVDSLT